MEARYMTSNPTDWHQALARVSGQLVRGEQRVATRELLTVHLGVPVTDRACRWLRRVMHDLGWHGGEYGIMRDTAHPIYRELMGAPAVAADNGSNL